MALVNDEDIKLRAYYLSEDDKKLNKYRQSDSHYYGIAQNIDKFMKDYYFFEDTIDNTYSACRVCFEYYAKVQCVNCKQHACARCMLKLEACPFCRNVRKKKYYLKKYNTSTI